MNAAPAELPDELRIESVSSHVIRIPRNLEQAVGGAGSPSPLKDDKRRYRPAKSYATVYSQEIECLLVQVRAGGYVGWGEAQAPVAPEICHSIIEHLIGPLLIDEPAPSPGAVYSRIYDSMRVRGHSGGFYLDALAAVDIALWDLLGKVTGKPIAALLGGALRTSVPSYVSGLIGDSEECQVSYALDRVDQGARAFKVYWPAGFDQGLKLIERLRAKLPQETEIYVDALWRMNRHQAAKYAQLLADLRVGWLEAPLVPEDIAGHAWLSNVSPVPIAIGESYRSSWDFVRLAEERAADILQPDLGRCGITTTRFVTELCAGSNLGFAPHVSISLGPQLAAAIHVAAIAPTLVRAESNPDILAVARKFSDIAVKRGFSDFEVPIAPGLGVDISEKAIQPYITASTTVT